MSCLNVLIIDYCYLANLKSTNEARHSILYALVFSSKLMSSPEGAHCILEGCVLANARRACLRLESCTSLDMCKQI